MTERKLATVRRVADIQPIEGADMIHVVTVDGWKVVAQKAMGYKIGDLVVYFEIDSFIPHELAPFLTKEAAYPKEFNGVKGERLRTIKLRGQVSQGLLFPLKEAYSYMDAREGVFAPSPEEGLDLTEVLGVQKWEAPVPGQLAGQAQGTFPTHIVPKTDQERIQNMWREVDARRGELYEMSLKLDGSSCTLFKKDGEVRVCSRNWELKVNEENKNNTFISFALKFGERLPEGYAFQGEAMGPGIQGNREQFKDHRFFVFEIVDLATRTKVDADFRAKMVTALGMDHAPLIGSYREFPFATLEEALAEVEKMKSINHPIAEGVVFKSLTDPEFSFKIISNKFLLKGGD